MPILTRCKSMNPMEGIGLEICVDRENTILFHVGKGYSLDETIESTESLLEELNSIKEKSQS